MSPCLLTAVAFFATCFPVSPTSASDRGIILDTLTEQEAELIEKLPNTEKLFVTLCLSGDGIPRWRGWSTLSTGEMFIAGNSIKVDQVVSGSSFIGYGQSVWVDGLNTTNLSDGDNVSCGSTVFTCTGNKQYTTVLGGSKTVMRLKAFNTRASLDVVKKIAEAHEFRVWGEGSDAFVVAKYKQRSGSRVVLITPKSKPLRIKESAFTKADQEWIAEYRRNK